MKRIYQYYSHILVAIIAICMRFSHLISKEPYTGSMFDLPLNMAIIFWLLMIVILGTFIVVVELVSRIDQLKFDLLNANNTKDEYKNYIDKFKKQQDAFYEYIRKLKSGKIPKDPPPFPIVVLTTRYVKSIGGPINIVLSIMWLPIFVYLITR